MLYNVILYNRKLKSKKQGWNEMDKKYKMLIYCICKFIERVEIWKYYQL